jgi:hypothetical protein
LLDNQLTDGSEVVSLMCQLPFTPRRIPGAHSCWRLSWPQGHGAAGRIWSIEKSNDLIGNRTHDLPACSIVPRECNYISKMQRRIHGPSEYTVASISWPHTISSETSLIIKVWLAQNKNMNFGNVLWIRRWSWKGTLNNNWNYVNKSST